MTYVPQVSRRLALAALALAFTVAAGPLGAARADEPVPANDLEHVDLFEAMDAGQVDVKFIPQNATQANVLVKNLTDQPLNLRLPAAFAGVPVLAQGMGGGMGGMGGGMGGGGMGGGGMGGGGGGQAMGGGMGGGGGGGMGGMGGGGMGGMGGGMMRVAPEKMRKVAVTTVCLEHGKPDPNPKMAYKIVPLEHFTDDSRVRLLCEALGNGQVAQNTAQAAAWHLTDQLPWEQLASMNRVESQYVGTIKWFSPLELRTAFTVVNEVTRIAEEEKASDYESDASEQATDDATLTSNRSTDR